MRYYILNIYLNYNNAVHIYYTMPRGKPKLKTATITLRVEPQVKTIAELAAKQDHRSLTNLVEVLILNHCDKLGIKTSAPSHKEVK